MDFMLNQKSKLSNARGFTLLEILIVLGILGTIMTMVLGRVNGSRNRAKVKQSQLELNQWSEAINMYYNECGKYPATLDAIKSDDAGCSSWEPGAYSKLNTNDTWGGPIQYSTEGGGYTLKSLGKDKKEGGTGFDSDVDAGSGEG
jgi:general secretion pathway protein G